MNEIINITPSNPPNLMTTSVGEVGTIKLNNLPNIKTNERKSVNFGPGAEMLMNDKRRSTSPKSDINLSDLESLDKNIDLNESNISKKNAK